MITAANPRAESIHGAGVVTPITFYGLSTDDKPVAPNGSCFKEMDTAKEYYYDAAGAQWYEWAQAAAPDGGEG